MLFVPSERLIRYWTHGILERGGRGLKTKEKAYLLQPETVTELQPEFTHVLFGTIIKELRIVQTRNSEPAIFPFFGEGAFFEKLKERIIDIFPVRSRDIDDFLKLLEEEFTAAIIAEPLKASWGELCADGEKVFVRLNPDMPVLFTKATKKVLDIDL